MDDVTKETELTNSRSVDSAEETVVAVARKVGATVGAIASKVTSASRKRKPGADAFEERRREIKKKKKIAHRHKLKGSHTKG